MMINTERKLDEARFFLNQLNTDDPYFDYILSAYLNSARSTPWIMRNEFCKIKGWEEWFRKSEVSQEEAILLKDINELRITSTKKEGVKTEFYFLDHIVPDEQYYPVIKEMLNKFKGEEVTITLMEDLSENEITPNTQEEIYSIKGMVKIPKDESKMSREVIYHLCFDYFKFLEKHVSSCMLKFGTIK